MEKAEDAVRTIGEVSLMLGLKPHILRYWEEQFPSLKPMKRSGGRRYYRKEDVALLMRIDELLNKEGYTIKGAKKALKSSKLSKNKFSAANDQKDTGEQVQKATDQQATLPSEIHQELLAIRESLRSALG